jgi:integrase
LTVSFEAAAKAFFDQHQIKWGPKSRSAFLNTMASHVYPTIGQLPIDMVDTPMVLKVIEPIWLTHHVTAGRVRGRLEAVLAWAAVRGFRPAGDNPARWKGHLDQLLPVGGTIGEVEHHPALPYIDVPAFVDELRRRPRVGTAALEFLILGAARSGEVLRATWSEVDFEAGIWLRPASHMKGKVEHAVPLSPRAIEILRALPRGGGADLIFTSKTGGSLGKNAMPKLLKGAEFTVHGFRSSFRDWAGESTNFPRELAEHALAHVVGGKVEGAYARGKQVEKRRRLMEAWEKFVATPAAKSANVTPIRRGSNSA